MKKRKNKQQNNEYLKRIADYFIKSQDNDSSLKVYQHVKSAITELATICKENDRLPAIRAISVKLGVATLPIQRAVTELINEDILYAKNGVGLFVKNPPLDYMTKLTMSHAIKETSSIGLFFNYFSEDHRNMMIRIMDKYKREHSDYPNVKLFFEKNVNEKIDITFAIQPDDFREYLNLSDFASHEINKGNLKIQGRYCAPLAYVSYYLFYNEELLKKIGLETPQYKNFNKQEQYIRDAKQVAERKGLQSPTSWNRPPFFLGKLVEDVLKFLKGDEGINSANGKRVYKIIEKVMNYYNLFVYKRKGATCELALEHFLTGQTPLFCGYTNCFSLFKELHKPDFKWNAYPIFACDNTFPFQPVYATVNVDTKFPRECVKLLMYLQGELVQKEFYNQGFITIQNRGQYLDPVKGHVKAAENSFPAYFEDPADKYIFEYILDLEMFECQVGEGIDHTFENIFHYSRAYLRNFIN